MEASVISGWVLLTVRLKVDVPVPPPETPAVNEASVCVLAFISLIKPLVIPNSANRSNPDDAVAPDDQKLTEELCFPPAIVVKCALLTTPLGVLCNVQFPVNFTEYLAVASDCE